MRRVRVESYNHKWPTMFQEESRRLHQIFKSEIIAIHHIGSTAVKGMCAKPVIDLMPVVKDITLIDYFNDAMDMLDYEAKGENGLIGRRYFQKGGDQRTHHVHIYEENNSEVIRHLAFRDYLRTYPSKAEAYSSLKLKLARQFPNDIASYIQGKSAFVSCIEKEAIAWYASNER